VIAHIHAVERVGKPLPDHRASPAKIEALTSIRFFAAISVVFFHVGYTAVANWYAPLAAVTSYGYAAVGLFYILSGFVLAHTYLDRRTDLRAFYFARFARIYPLYLLALILAFPVFAQRAHLGEYSAVRFFASVLTVPTMLQAWVPATALAWNAPAWSLSAEAFFYLVFPFILARLASRTSGECYWIAAIMWPISLLPSLVYCWLNPDGLGSLTGPHLQTWLKAETTGWLAVVNFNPLCRLPEFVAGVAVGCAFRKGGGRELRSIAFLFPACLLAVAPALPYPVVHNGFLLPLWCTVIYFLASSVAASKLLAARWLILLGEASYGIYILQQPVSNWFKLTILGVTGRRLEGDYPSLWFLLAYCLILVVVSVLSYHQIEIPLRAWMRNQYSWAHRSVSKTAS
jgi:peptidoglycan/LPS O-acetylase OafA/YrhL